MTSLLAGPVRVINIGLASFARDLAANGAAVAQVDWTPPAGGRPELISALSFLSSFEKQISEANRQVLERIVGAEPVLTDVRPAGELIAELMLERLLLHAGPPI